jgi:hypothetical protein
MIFNMHHHMISTDILKSYLNLPIYVQIYIITLLFLRAKHHLPTLLMVSHTGRVISKQ